MSIMFNNGKEILSRKVFLKMKQKLNKKEKNNNLCFDVLNFLKDKYVTGVTLAVIRSINVINNNEAIAKVSLIYSDYTIDGIVYITDYENDKKMTFYEGVDRNDV